MDNGAVSVEAAIDGMFEAMDQQDLDRLAALCARDPDAVHLGTDRGERWVGWEALHTASRHQFERLRSFRVEPEDRVIGYSASESVARFYQRLDAEIVTVDGRTILRGARLTGVAERRNRGWVLVQTHLSLPGD